MRFFQICLLAAAVCGAAAAADVPSVNGNWQVHISIQGNESDSVCTFVQKDGVLTGTCKSDNGSHELTGKVTGEKVAWSYKSEYNGSPLTINFDGTVDSGKAMKGSVDVPEFSVDGDFTATLTK
jgi:hypothetical protein